MIERAHSENILAAVEEALSQISESAGKSFTPRKVARYDRDTNPLADAPSIEISRASEVKGESEFGGNDFAVELEFDLLITIYEEANALEPTDILMSKASHDVEEALSNMDWPGLRAFLRSIQTEPFYAREVNEIADGVAMRVICSWTVDRSDLAKSIS